VSSAVYLYNDVNDREQDRLHPDKRHRPIASGELSTTAAVAAVVILLAAAVAGAAIIGWDLAFILFGYWLINFLYSTWLKHHVILDVFSVALGFVLRVLAGGIAIEVEISHWLVLCTTLLALFLGFGKRRYEIRLLADGAVAHRQVLQEYDSHFLDMMIAVVTAATLMSYILYAVSDETLRRFQTRALILTVPFVLYGIFRYLYLIYHKEQGGDPAQVLLGDLPMMINLSLWAATAGAIVYWR
jgi:4-hydroxybenzoate polyprenyltransferase